MQLPTLKTMQKTDRMYHVPILQNPAFTDLAKSCKNSPIDMLLYVKKGGEHDAEDGISISNVNRPKTAFSENVVFLGALVFALFLIPKRYFFNAKNMHYYLFCIL